MERLPLQTVHVTRCDILFGKVSFLLGVTGVEELGGRFPTVSAPQIATLNFKDEVELLDTSGGWGRIREVRRDIVVWSNMRYLVPVTDDNP